VIYWTIRPVTRRSFVLAVLIPPVTGLGCGGEGVSANTKAGYKRRERVESLQNRAALKGKSEKKKSP
jgi:hypothetical protein